MQARLLIGRHNLCDLNLLRADNTEDTKPGSVHLSSVSRQKTMLPCISLTQGSVSIFEVLRVVAESATCRPAM